MIQFYTIFLLVFLPFSGNAFGEEKDMRKTFYSKAFEVLADGFADDSNSNLQFAGIRFETQEKETKRLGEYTYSFSYFRTAFIHAISKIGGRDIPSLGKCGNNFCYIYNSLHLDREDMKVMDSIIKEKFQIAFIRRFEKTKMDNSFFTYYNGAGIRYLFDRLYIGPKAEILGFSAKDLYHFSFRTYLRNRLEILQAMVSDPKRLDSWTKDYKLRSDSDPMFTGTLYTQDVAVSVCGSKNYCDHRFVGMILRRNMDGTLPTVRNILRKITLDYDPELFEQFSGAL